VEVEQGVQLVESQPTVTAKDRETRRAKRATTEQRGALVQWWKRCLVVLGWSATVAPLDAGPQTIAERAELVEDFATATAE
jgi:hypothetical protein